MNINKICLSLGLSLLFFGCKNEVNPLKGLTNQNYKADNFQPVAPEKAVLKEIIVPSSSNYDGKILEMGNLVDSCYMIPLETTVSNLIGEIDDIKVFENKIFVLDSRKAKAVYMFDMEGQFLRKIGNSGKGPGEYPYPEDFDIDPKNKEILVFNGNVRRIYRYNFNGDFKGTIEVGLGCYGIKLLDDGNIMLFAGDYGNFHLGELENRIFYVIDQQGEIISYGPSLSRDFKDIQTSLLNKSMVKNQTISYSHKFSDTIYQMKGSSLERLFKIVFRDEGNRRERFTSLNTPEFIAETKKGDFPYFLGQHYLTPDYLYFRFTYNQKIIHCYYNRLQDKLIIGSKVGANGLSCVGNFIPLSSHGDYFINSIDAIKVAQIKDYLGSSSESNDVEWQPLKNELYYLEIKESDNPVLVFFRLKKDIK